MKKIKFIFKFNSRTVASGIFEIKLPVDNSVILSFEAFNFDAGQYKKIFGRTLGGFCDIIYDPSFKDVTQDFWNHINISVPYGSCPLPSQVLYVNDHPLKDLGEYLPPYIPGGERWKVNLWFSKNEKIIGGLTEYAIIRDNQKLFDSKFGRK